MASDENTGTSAATSLASMIISSVDTLREMEVDQTIPDTWNERPPLLGTDRAPETLGLLKATVRAGIPPALRCAVWMSNIVQSVLPHEEPKLWHEYRTLAKVRALDHAYEHVVSQLQLVETITPPDSDSNNGQVGGSTPNNDATATATTVWWPSVRAPTYGRSNHDTVPIPGCTEKGMVAYKRVLLVLDRILGIDWAPLVPNLCALLLTAMSESYTFAAMRQMSHHTAWYFPVSEREHHAWCLAFGDVLHKLHHLTGAYLMDRGVLDLQNLDPIFKDFFVGIMPIQYILRIFDIYTLEGSKVLFRFGVALFVLFKKESAEQLLTISNADEWWDQLKQWTFSARFDFDLLVQKAYAVHGRGIRRQLRFPRRQILGRIIRIEEDRLAREGEDDTQYSQTPSQPLGLVLEVEDSATGEEPAKPLLVLSRESRLHLAQWMPLSIRLTNLELLYTTNHHGRSLEMFYRRVRRAKHTILLCEVLSVSSSSAPTTTESGHAQQQQQQQPLVVGMYASQPWRPYSQVYGDGGCFLFRLQPEARCWKWNPAHPLGSTSSTARGNSLDQVDLEESESSTTATTRMTALLEQFMVSTNKFISMGGNPDGSCGLRLNDDFTKGESSTAVGFDNEPLHGSGQGSMFEVGVVEVYGLVRQIDGKSV